MKALAQSEIIALITDLNAFADSAETLINTTQTNYDKDKRLLLNRHSSVLSTLDSTYKANCASVENKSKQTISDAKKILSEITKLDEKLSSVDKYYVKTKKKKEELLSDTTSDVYDDATDYFNTLETIKESFKTIYKKYSEDILPGLINGLNYLFSSQRKKDYEELIILRNTVAAFVKEIEEMLPPLTEENLATLKEEYFTQRGTTVERQKSELAVFENNHLATLDKVADKICTDLDNILPDEFVEYLFAIMANYAKAVHKVNASTDVQDEVLNICYVDYPIDFFVESKIVASIIKEKCSKLLVEGAIRLPIMMSTRNAPVWMITNDNSNSTAVQAFTHSIMYGLLSSCPVEKLTYTIVDPENRGNSIAPFFDAKKKLPELFGEKIYISKDEVAAKVSKLNEKIENMLTFTHHVIWSFLSFMPVTKVNICVFDSEQRGNSIIPFLDFRKRSPETFDQKIYTGQEQMYDRLQKINSQIDEFIQEKLGNRYKDILDYNLNTPNRAEPVTLLVLYDFPSGMDGRSIDLLTNILRNGNKCGVFTMICYNPNITFSRYESIDERLEQISRYCASIDYKDGHYSLLPYNLQINTPELLSYNATDAFIADYIEKSETIKKQGLSFKGIISKDLFSLDSSKSLKIPVGVGDGDSIINITIGEGSSHHGLIAGATGSGKSTLLHTLIMSSMLHYSPDQLHLYLMDFKSGTEFKIYESVKLPHIQLLALDAMQEFGESILENLVTEMERRGSLFKEAGQTSLKGYVQATRQPLPRILVIMDEFQILFNDSTNRKVAMNCAELTKRIVTEGRAFGIHLLMATQSTKVISDLTLSRGTIEQMRIRIGLKCGEDDARYLFSDQNDTKALAMMKGPIGTAVMNLDYTEQSNIGFRAAYCDDATQKYYLDLISETFAEQPSTLQTFEGSRTTNLVDYFADANIGTTSELPAQIHMGTLIKVAPPFAICIDKKKKHNLLVCGSNERMANTISNNYMISALLNRNATVYCIDGDKLVGDDDSADFYDTLGECSIRFKVAQDRADIIKFINEVYQSYQSWKKQNSDDVIFMVIKNLQFLDIVKSMFKGDVIDESEFIDEVSAESEFNPADPFAAVNNMFANRGNDDNMSVGEKLIKMVEDGSGFGIHFVVTSLEYQSVRECMYYGENILTKFPERIIFSLGSNDADNLIENVSVAGLRDNTVYFTDGVKNTFQMKPYITPSASELKKLFN